jgi:hypothetical protein
MGLSTYEVDEFLKNRFHINICVILPIIKKKLLFLLSSASSFPLVRSYERPGSDLERVGHPD